MRRMNRAQPSSTFQCRSLNLFAIMSVFQCYILSVLCLISKIIASPQITQPMKAQTNTSSLIPNDALLLDELSSTFFNAPLTNTSLHALDPAILSIGCFSDIPRPLPLQRIIVDDYYEAVDNILTHESVMIPHSMHLPPRQQIILSQHDSCKIVLVSPDRLTVTPRFQLIFTAHVAAIVVQRCVTEEKRYWGGWARLWRGTSAGLAVVNPRALGPLPAVIQSH